MNFRQSSTAPSDKRRGDCRGDVMQIRNRSLPRNILLATDLSQRCDRAHDRAIELARRWGARLTVVHVLEPARDADNVIVHRAEATHAKALVDMERDFASTKL